MTTVILEEDENGDLILPIPVDILNQMGWDVGDELIFKEFYPPICHLKIT